VSLDSAPVDASALQSNFADCALSGSIEGPMEASGTAVQSVEFVFFDCKLQAPKIFFA
jgi:hypothetical protein